jgi:HEPN domain-containing protein
MTPFIEEARRLLSLAQGDYAAFTVLRAHPSVPLAPTCFHGQQCVEKALKAVLTARQVFFRRVHDLEEITNLLTDAHITPPFPAEQYGLLNPFAVGMRYDDRVAPLITLEETDYMATRTLRWAEELVSRATV